MSGKASLIWLDLEMTGLEPQKHQIVEIATIVTDDDLNILAEGPNLVIHADEAALSKMDEWCVNMFGKNGLTEKIKASPITMAQAEQETIDFLAKYVEAGATPLCGNSIHQDRRFLERDMPKLHDFFHYRNLDVSTLKEISRRWYPEMEMYKKTEAHTALSDIRESIGELQYYRKQLFIGS